MINVIEHTNANYPGRTAVNAKDSDGTIAFAYDFESAGEKLTEKMCKQYGKPILKIQLRTPLRDVEEVSDRICSWLKKHDIRHVNIAGNGIRTMQGVFSQETLDTYLYKIFEAVLKRYEIKHGRSGGQTGIDEAGVKALDQLGVETTIVYPKGYRIKTMNGDVYDKQIASSRFDEKINVNLELETAKYGESLYGKIFNKDENSSSTLER